MSDILDELNDDLRQEKLEKFWKENGRTLIAAVLFVIITTGVTSYWMKHQNQENIEQTAMLLEAKEAGNVENLLSYAGSANKKHAVLAKFVAAEMLDEQGKEEDALSLFNEISKTKGLSPVYKDLAKLSSITRRMETEDSKALIDELDVLTRKKGALRFSAWEMQALLSAKEGKFKEAVSYLEQILNESAIPQGIKSRALSLRGLYISQTERASADK